MFTLIKNANLYAPAYLGKTDILLCGEKIAHISKTIELNESFCHTIDVQGKIVTPGFIDQHVHITGGGGLQGDGSHAGLPAGACDAFGGRPLLDRA